MLSEVSVHHDGVGLFEPSGSQHGGQEAERENVLAGFFLALWTEPPACGTMQPTFQLRKPLPWRSPVSAGGSPPVPSCLSPRRNTGSTSLPRVTTTPLEASRSTLLRLPPSCHFSWGSWSLSPWRTWSLSSWYTRYGGESIASPLEGRQPG